MKALVKLQSGTIRVENPPMSEVVIVKDESDTKLSLKIRFAFDVTKIAAGKGSTVRLDLKTRTNPRVSSANVKNGVTQRPSFKSATENESKHKDTVESIIVKTFEFNLTKALPDGSLTKINAENLIKYDYLDAVTFPPAKVGAKQDRVSVRDYLLSKIVVGTDPATLRENFPVLDPSKKSMSPLNSTLDNYFTRPVTRTTAYQKMSKASKYAIFEQKILVSITEFMSAPVYKFSYLNLKGAPVEVVEVKVDVSSIHTQLKKLEYTDEKGVNENVSLDSKQPNEISYTREAKTSTSMVTARFVQTSGKMIQNTPNIVRKHYKRDNSNTYSPSFQSFVNCLPEKRKKIVLQMSSTKSIVVPFYIDNVGNQLAARITKMPPLANRATILARSITNGENNYTEIASVITKAGTDQLIKIPALKSGVVYEFKIALVDSKMRTRTSCNSVVYNYSQKSQNTVLSVSQPLVDNQKVKFRLSANFNGAGRQDITSLIDSIKSSGVSDTVFTNFISNPDLYSGIFSCKIEKIELDTGVQSSTKEIPLGSSEVEFLDSIQSSVGAVFVFSLGIRSPSSLVPSQASYKWGTFGGKYPSSLPSEASKTIDGRTGASFEAIDSGIKKIIYVPSSQMLGKVLNLSLSRTMRNSHFVEWTYSGDISEVDHFQILGSADGAECLLGCSFRSNSYEDFTLFGRPGIVNYRVRPIYVTLEPGLSTNISVYNRSTLPTLVADVFSNGQASQQQVISSDSKIQQISPSLSANKSLTNIAKQS